MRKKKKRAVKINENAGLDKNLLGGSAQIIIGNFRYVYLHEIVGAGNFGLGKSEVVKKLSDFLKSAKKSGVKMEEVWGLFDSGLGVACVVRIEDLNRGITTLGLENGLPDVKKMLLWVERELLEGVRRVWGVGDSPAGFKAWKKALKRFGGGGSMEIDYEP